jgi:excisionase family DNA binding protein
MDNKPIQKRLLSVEEAAVYLNISPRTLYNRVAPRSKNPINIRIRRIGKLVRIDKKDLDDYINSL